MLLVILPKVRGVYFFPKIIFFPRPTFESHIFSPDHNLRFLPYLNPICINIHIKNFLIISKNIFYLKLLIFPLEIFIVNVFFCVFLHFSFIFPIVFLIFLPVLGGAFLKKIYTSEVAMSLLKEKKIFE